MSFFKSIIAFIISIILSMLIYNYIAIPLVPALPIYCCALFLSDDKFSKFRYFLVILNALFAVYMYGYATYYSIVFYPQYQSILGIIANFVNILAIITAVPMFSRKNY